MTAPRLLAITPPSGPVAPAIVDAWLAAEAGDVLMVLLREPGRGPDELLDARHRLAPLRRRCQEARIPLVLSVAREHLDAGCRALLDGRAIGLQVRGDPAPDVIAQLRAQVGDALLGRSCHGAPDPAPSPVDYTCLAPIFAPTTTQPGREKRPVGLDVLAAWAAARPEPILALGGIHPANADACARRGAWGFAGIGVFFGEPERVVEDVAALRRALPPTRARRAHAVAKGTGGRGDRGAQGASEEPTSR
ncbi:MAG: thiamine phosphate synthase [Myxococcales bacterium]|nr:thiamine phosphate synthase [Myxococcales bacterium]